MVIIILNFKTDERRKFFPPVSLYFTQHAPLCARRFNTLGYLSLLKAQNLQKKLPPKSLKNSPRNSLNFSVVVCCLRADDGGRRTEELIVIVPPAGVVCPGQQLPAATVAVGRVIRSSIVSLLPQNQQQQQITIEWEWEIGFLMREARTFYEGDRTLE